MAQLPSQSHFGDYAEWPGRDVLDSGGERLGGVREIYLDRETGQPEWVLVDVDGGEARFVPLADAAVESSTIRVAHSASTIRNAPGIGAEPRIDQSEERRLYEHYGLGYSEHESDSGLPAETGEAPACSWSDVAPKDTVDAPPPAEPPSPAELERADIPEPPAATDRASEYETFVGKAVTPPPADEPIAARVADDEPTEPPDTPPPFIAPEPFGATPAREDDPSAELPAAAAEPVPPPADEPFGGSTPAADTTPPVAPAVPLSDEAPSPPVSVPHGAADQPAPFSEPPRSSWSPPPQPERGGGPLDRLKSRPGGIAAGVAIAIVLLMIIRRLR